MRMSTSHCTIITAIAAFFLSAAILSAVGPAEAADALPPFKDDLFSKQSVLETGDGGAFEVIDYDEMRDINGRDQIPQKRVQQKYVTLGIRKAQADETLSLDGIKLDVTRVGPAGNAAFTVIFIHGGDLGIAIVQHFAGRLGVDLGDLQQDLRRGIGADSTRDRVDRTREGGCDAGAAEDCIIGGAGDTALAFDGNAERRCDIGKGSAFLRLGLQCFGLLGELGLLLLRRPVLDGLFAHFGHRAVAVRRDFADVEPDIAVVTDRQRRRIDADLGLEGFAEQLLPGWDILDLLAILVGAGHIDGIDSHGGELQLAGNILERRTARAQILDAIMASPCIRPSLIIYSQRPSRN